VCENNPFERASKTFRLSMDVMQLRRAARALREFGVVAPEQKTSESFCAIFAGYSNCLKGLHGSARVARVSRPRQN